MKMGRVAVAAALSALAFTGSATAAHAEIASKSNGVGVCLSQVATDPSIVGLDRLGDGIRERAKAQTVPTDLDGSRNACGEPPGPRHRS